MSMLAEDDGDRVEAAYGTQYTRRAALKRKYDPENLFRLNPDLTYGFLDQPGADDGARTEGQSPRSSSQPGV